MADFADSTRAPAGATTFTTNSDTAILAAWERLSAARTAYANIPEDQRLPSGLYTPAEQEQWRDIDAAEAAIQGATATTPEGAEIQLWVSLAHSVTGWDDERAARERNLEFFLADESRLDWTDRLMVAAIRSLRAMSAKEGEAATAIIDGEAEQEAQSWEAARAAFDAKSAEVDATTASDALLDEYWRLWEAAMLCPADSIDAAQWKFGQFARITAECGEFSEDLAEQCASAIFADVARHARKWGEANVSPTLWAASMDAFLAARTAEVKFDEAVWTPAYEASENDARTPIAKGVEDQMEQLTSARLAAEELLIKTPTNDPANVRWKLAYGRLRFLEDFCDFPEDWWQAIFADLEGIGKGGEA